MFLFSSLSLTPGLNISRFLTAGLSKKCSIVPALAFDMAFNGIRIKLTSFDSALF